MYYIALVAGSALHIYEPEVSKCPGKPIVQSHSKPKLIKICLTIHVMVTQIQISALTWTSMKSCQVKESSSLLTFTLIGLAVKCRSRVVSLYLVYAFVQVKEFAVNRIVAFCTLSSPDKSLSSRDASFSASKK